MAKYKEFTARIRKRIWPSGEPRNLVDAHNEMFKQAMIDLGKWVEILQQNNTSVFPACSSYVDCGKTIVDCPLGSIKRVYTIANDEFCDKVFYWKASYKELDCHARNLINYWVEWEAPANAGMPALQQGIKFAEKSTDSPYGRARTGVWATWRGRFYVFPWLQSNEQLVVEWDGYKRVWGDEDVIDEALWAPETEAAIESYVRWQHEKNYGDPARGELHRQQYEGHPGNPGGQRGDLMHTSKKLIEQRDAIEPCVETRRPTLAEFEDDAVPTITTGANFAIIGDFGNPNNGTAELDVSNLVKGWDDGTGTFFILSTGDNIYAPEDSYADAVGAFYGDYVKPDLISNRFWPVPGNHDYTDPVNGINDYLAYFHLPNNGRYYDFVKGPVHFFMLNSSIDGAPGQPALEPDGVTVDSVQANWLRVKLALSTARWKVVIVQDSPYTLGGDYPGHTVLRWPFKLWGADVVITGDIHAYERYEVDGLPYIVNGAGGATILSAFNADAGNLITPFNKFKYNTDHGAMKAVATCDSLKFEFWNRAGVLIDTLTLEAA